MSISKASLRFFTLCVAFCDLPLPTIMRVCTPALTQQSYRYLYPPKYNFHTKTNPNQNPCTPEVAFGFWVCDKRNFLLWYGGKNKCHQKLYFWGQTALPKRNSQARNNAILHKSTQNFKILLCKNSTINA
ncbi:Uncharacterised protein [Helicobacter pullorum]|uniref:Uncharacterized protein n=1 Tax=Helicobacter pullorum TaxID=35818 RepID=A0A377Q128_9HELI|nr:Uncharacterised protein [Helicobacter pullorum]